MTDDIDLEASSILERKQREDGAKSITEQRESERKRSVLRDKLRTGKLDHLNHATRCSDCIRAILAADHSTVCSSGKDEIANALKFC